MKKILLVLFTLISLISNGQLISLVVRNDTLFGFDPSTGVYTQYTKLVSTPIGQSGKAVTSNGTNFTWSTFLSPTGDGSGLTGLTATQVGLGNVTNESKATMFTNPTFTGSVTLPDNTVTNSMLAGSIATSKISNYTGYSINVQALTSSPTDAQTVYFGTLPKAPVTAAATSKIYIRKACTLKIAEIYCYSGTAGTNESWSLYVRVNNTTDNLIATVSASASERIFSNTGLNISLNAGDYIEIKGVQPTWATNPLTTIYGGYLYFE